MIGIGLGFGKGRAGLGRYGAGSWVPTLVLDYKRGVYISAPAPTVARAGTVVYRNGLLDRNSDRRGVYGGNRAGMDAPETCQTASEVMQ